MASRFRDMPEADGYEDSREDRASYEPETDPARHNADPTPIQNISLETLLNICPDPPALKDMQDTKSPNDIFLIRPFQYSPASPELEPVPIYPGRYIDHWDKQHVRMPCSPENRTRDGRPHWPIIRSLIMELKQSCDTLGASVEDLEKTIERCAERSYDMHGLRHIINDVYSDDQRREFMSVVLSRICSLAIHVDLICTESPTLLSIDSNRSVTMSQWQAASLLACSFFCLFPHRQGRTATREYKSFPRPNFNTLYQHGPENKISKLQCILHYFKRIATDKPIGVITFRRFALTGGSVPNWSKSKKSMAPMHVHSAKKIEEIDCTLQVDFANKYIGGGVLTTGCVQEEIRFALCPETLVSLLLCEVMEPNECIFLIGCEQYSTQVGYGTTFKFGDDFVDTKARDSWGRRWSHLVAIDAIFFRNPAEQYTQKNVERELTKAYTGFYTKDLSKHSAFPIVTGHWGCGAFNGDKHLKAIIQLMAASEVPRPLIYSAHHDERFVLAFVNVYDHLIREQARVRDLYLYLRKYCSGSMQISFFDFILSTPVSSLDS